MNLFLLQVSCSCGFKLALTNMYLKRCEIYRVNIPCFYFYLPSKIDYSLKPIRKSPQSIHKPKLSFLFLVKNLGFLAFRKKAKQNVTFRLKSHSLICWLFTGRKCLTTITEDAFETTPYQGYYWIMHVKIFIMNNNVLSSSLYLSLNL